MGRRSPLTDGETQLLRLPSEPFRLEEANLPPDMAQSLAGQSVQVSVLPEENSTEQFDEYVPVRVSFSDKNGKVWRLPRRWLVGARTSEPPIDPYFPVQHKIEFVEELTFPTKWDLFEINMVDPEPLVKLWALTPREVRVSVAPEEPIKIVFKRRVREEDISWRIPHDWRKRRIRLPSSEVLIGQGVPDCVAERFAQKVVRVNYHPGSLCCLPEQYRFRDEDGWPWPIYIRDCVLVGLGNVEEFRA